MRADSINNGVIYCHFNFKRPKGKDIGYFAVAFYSDYEGKKLIYQITRQYPLWENQQFVTAIQAYEHALLSIYEKQGELSKYGIGKVMLVTDNSTLAGWIQNPKKNKKYTEYMNRAVQNYRVGGIKEIVLGIGLCDVRDYEKSYKFCNEAKVVNNKADVIKKDSNGNKVIDINSAGITCKTIKELNDEAPSKPEIIGM